MVRKKGKAVSFDAMVKFFLHSYQIPTKRDVERILARLDRLEAAVGAVASGARSREARRSRGAAADVVLDLIRRSKQGVKFADIQNKTGFAEKKVRNIIFRLHKLEKIKRHSRGVYIAI
ncbi:MAG: hypothetical protein MUF46_09235 [Desulfobacterales bacterium]|jgi:hypothetical protein|nr:hypothetical protein [Desulfobacterales bacterium]